MPLLSGHKRSRILTRSMADVTYNTASFPSLISTLKQLYSNSPSSSHPSDTGTYRHPAVLLAYKERHPSEREFFELVQEVLGVGVKFVYVGSENGAGGAPVEIYLLDEMHS